MKSDGTMSRSSVPAGLALILSGAILNFLVGLFAIGVGAYFLGLMGGGARSAAWLAWSFIVFGAIAIAGGEVGLGAYRKGRAKDIQAAARRALLAAMLPPIQVLLLIGAILCWSAKPIETVPKEQPAVFR